MGMIFFVSIILFSARLACLPLKAGNAWKEDTRK